MAYTAILVDGGFTENVQGIYGVKRPQKIVQKSYTPTVWPT